MCEMTGEYTITIMLHDTYVGIYYLILYKLYIALGRTYGTDVRHNNIYD